MAVGNFLCCGRQCLCGTLSLLMLWKNCLRPRHYLCGALSFIWLLEFFCVAGEFPSWRTSFPKARCAAQRRFGLGLNRRCRPPGAGHCCAANSQRRSDIDGMAVQAQGTPLPPPRGPPTKKSEWGPKQACPPRIPTSWRICCASPAFGCLCILLVAQAQWLEFTS